MTHYSYGPGDWTALAHGGRGALLDPSIDAGAVDEIWQSLSHDGALESWLEVLAGKGLAALPSFGFVEPGADGVRVVVRGDVTAQVGDYDVSAGGMRTWREHVAPADAGVVLRVGDSEARYPLLGGVVLAAALQVGEVAQPTETEPSADQEQEPAPAGGDDAAAAAAAVAAAEPVIEPDGEAETEPIIEPEPEAGQEPEGEPEPAQQEAEAAAAEDVEPDFVLEDDDGDDGEGEGEGEDGDVVGNPEGDWAQAAAAVQMEHLPDGQHAAGEAELPPWAPPPGVAPQASQWGPPSGAAVPAPEAAPDLGDHDGYTMRATDLPSSDQSGADQPSPVDQTLAPAHEDDHANGAADSQHAQLSLSTGQQIELDRPVLIGRAPESSRFGFGETPRLVTVPSPQQDISRTHVEIKLEGDNVLVTDLRSTNGTVVVLPGSPPRRLHPGESVPVPTGTVVDLGDGVTAVVDPPSSTAPIAY